MHDKPHNTTLVFLGTCFIWFGWFGFNGGSALNGTIRAMYAAFNTNTAASTGAIGWVIVDMIKHKGKFSVVGACEGAIVSPALCNFQLSILSANVHSRLVLSESHPPQVTSRESSLDQNSLELLTNVRPRSVWLAAVIGFLTAVVCALCQNVNEWMRVDEGLYVFKLHGIGGMMGSFLTGIFANQAVSALDGVSLYPGGINGNGVQIGKQFAEITAISAYSFVVSCILLYALKYIPYMHLRVSEEAEMKGLDLDQFFDEQLGEWETYGAAGLDANPHIVVHGMHNTDDKTTAADNKQGSETPESHEDHHSVPVERVASKRE